MNGKKNLTLQIASAKPENIHDMGFHLSENWFLIVNFSNISGAINISLLNLKSLYIKINY